MPLDFSGQNLQGRNFKGQDLTGANFSYADIRGANFSNAILIGANFTKAKAGLQRRWATIIVIAAMLLASSAGFFAAIAGLSAAINLLGNDYVKSFTIFPGVVSLSFAAIYVGIQLNQRRFTALPEAIARVVTLTTMAVGTLVGVVGAVVLMAGSGTIPTAVAALLVGGLTAALDFCVQLTMSAVTIVAGVVSGSLIPILTVTGALIAAKFLVGELSGAVAMLLLITIAPVLQAIWVVHNGILAGDENVALTRTVAIVLASIGGTSFKKADLTDADFRKARLPSTDFTEAIITHTRFYEAEKLNRAKVGNSILAKQAIINLLVTCVGRGKDYAGANLRGGNLIGADLSHANFKEADISGATFQGANLEWSILTLTQAIKTDFTSAQMTGACVEAWNIESNTKLDNVDCRFIYLLENRKPGTDDRERRPSSGEFKPGEFTKLFEEVLTTVDLIFDKGIDWKAFIAAFKKVQVENEDTELTIQSIENKGDGVIVVRVSVPPDANKEKIHSDFTQNYALALKAVEEKYKAELQAKDREIQIYREKSVDMKEIIGLLATRPINVNNEAIATSESKSMSAGNEYNFPAAKIWGSSVGTNYGSQVGTQHNYPAPQNLDEAAKYIQQLLQELAKLEEKYKLEIAAKDEEIAENRQQIDYLRELAEKLAKTPIVINPNHKPEQG